jgi:hypothetical protein
MAEKPKMRATVFRTLARTVFELRRGGHLGEADDLEMAMHHTFPEFAEFYIAQVRRLQTVLVTPRRTNFTKTKTYTFDHAGVLTPTLA